VQVVPSTPSEYPPVVPIAGLARFRLIRRLVFADLVNSEEVRRRLDGSFADVLTVKPIRLDCILPTMLRIGLRTCFGSKANPSRPTPSGQTISTNHYAFATACPQSASAARPT